MFLAQFHPRYEDMLSLCRKYHTHKRLKESLAALAEEFPDITELTSIGNSVEVRQTSSLQYTQFLKGATVRPYGRAIFFRDCARVGFMNAKIHILLLFYLVWVIFSCPEQL